MNEILSTLRAAGLRLETLELPEAFSWTVVDGIVTTPSRVAEVARSLGYAVERPAPLRVMVTGDAGTLRLAFEPTGDELAQAAVASALIADGSVTGVEFPVPDESVIDRILDEGWRVPADLVSLASTATRLLMDRVSGSAARWEIELALAAEPSVLELARRVDALGR